MGMSKFDFWATNWVSNDTYNLHLNFSSWNHLAGHCLWCTGIFHWSILCLEFHRCLFGTSAVIGSEKIQQKWNWHRFTVFLNIFDIEILKKKSVRFRHTPPLNGLICYMFMKSHLIICHQIIWTVSLRLKRGQQALRVAICLFPWTTNSLHVGRIFAPGAGSSHRNPCRCFDRGDWKQVWATGKSSSCNIKNSRIKLPHKPSSNKPISRWMIYDQWLTLFKWNPCLVWIPLHGLSWFSMIGQLCQRKFPHFAHLAPRPFCSGLAHHSLAALHPSIAAPGFLHRCDFEVFGLVHHPLIHHYLPLFHLVRGRESGPFYFRRAYSTRGIDRSGFTSTFWFCSNINAHALQSYLWWSRMATCSQFIEWEHWLGFLAFG